MKVWPRIDVRLLGIVIFARLIPIWKVLFPIDAILFGIVILDKLEQEEKKKAKCSIDFTPSSIVMLVKLEQPMKTTYPIDITLFDNMTFVKL